MSDNEFQQQSDREQRRVQAEQISAIYEILKTLPEQVAALVKKEVRVVREDLRNLENLRALRPTKEEQAEQSETTDEAPAEGSDQ